MPSNQELDDSTIAGKHLALARRDLLDVMALLVSRGNKT
jgi:hypothetical protein